MNASRRLALICVSTLLHLFLSCDRPSATSAPSLALIPVGVLDLEEPESSPLGLTGGFTRGLDGGFFVSDRQHGTLIQYDATGRRVAEIGRRGDGPGEWSWGPFGVFVYDDSTLAVSDGEAVKVFPITRPAAGWTRAHSAFSPLLTADNAVLLFRRVSRTRRSTVGRYRDPSDSVEYGGPFPSQLGRSQIVDVMLSFVAALPVGADSLAVFTQGSDFLFVGPFAGPYDSLHIPAITRRGAMTEVLAAVNDEDPESGMKAAYQASYPLAVHRLPAPGAVAVLTIDQEFLGNRMAGLLQVAVANFRTKVVCGEVRVPVESDPQPWATVAGDTIFVFSHDTDSSAAQSQPRVRKFVIAANGC